MNLHFYKSYMELNLQDKACEKFLTIDALMDFIDEGICELPVEVYCHLHCKSTVTFIKVVQKLWERDFQVRGVPE